MQEKQETLPYSKVILALGIASIITCCFYWLPSVLCSVICLIMAIKGNKAYNLNPNNYTKSSHKNLKAGKICGIIGLILNIPFLIYIIFLKATLIEEINTILELLKLTEDLLLLKSN